MAEQGGRMYSDLEDGRFPLHIPDPDFDSRSDTYENALFDEDGDDGMVAYLSLLSLSFKLR